MTSEQWAGLSGQPAFDHKGQPIGDVRRIFYDESSNEPVWATVGARRYGEREAVVPLAGSQRSNNGIALAVRTSQVTHAPTIDADHDLTVAEADQVSRHYDMMPDEGEPPAPSKAAQAKETQAKGTQAKGTQTKGARQATPTKAELTRFEEQLEVGAETVETGKARLRKHVETEPVETDVTLRRERARLERMPARDTGDASSHRFGEETAEVTLHDQRARVNKKTVPVETVRLATEEESGQQHISDQVRKERIEVNDAPTGGRRRR